MKPDKRKQQHEKIDRSFASLVAAKFDRRRDKRAPNGTPVLVVVIPSFFSAAALMRGSTQQKNFCSPNTAFPILTATFHFMILHHWRGWNVWQSDSVQSLHLKILCSSQRFFTAKHGCLSDGERTRCSIPSTNYTTHQIWPPNGLFLVLLSLLKTSQGRRYKLGSRKNKTCESWNCHYRCNHLNSVLHHLSE